MRFLRAGLLVVVALLVVPSGTPVAALDGFRIEGDWEYRTTSNCGALGVGEVHFTRRADGDYDERGSVRWEDGLVVRWWGRVHLHRAARTVTGRLSNSLGDQVDGHWTFGAVPVRELRVAWDQTNGCHGSGVATRR